MTRRTTGVAPDAFPEVLAAARLGQPWAFEALYRGYASRSPATSGPATSAEPEHLVSEVFTSVFTGLARFTGSEADFRGWLFTIAQRRIVDDLRKRSRRVETTAYDPDTDDRIVGSAELASLDRLGEQWIPARPRPARARPARRPPAAHPRRPHRRAGGAGTRQERGRRQAAPAARAGRCRPDSSRRRGVPL